MKLTFIDKLKNWWPGSKDEMEPCIKKSKAGTFFFQIVDADSGKPLQGAEYTMYLENEPMITVASDSQGRVSFPCVYPGIYTLEETSPPEGYQPKQFRYSIIMDVFRMVTIDDMPVQMFKVLSKREPVIPRYSLVLYKLDAVNKEGLEGAKFRLYNDEIDKTEVSGEDGELDFGLIQPGAYTFCEIEAPIGYMKLKEDYKLDIKPNGTIWMDDVLLNDFQLTNYICTGFGIFRKTKEGKPVEGAVFEFRNHGRVIQTATTNSNGYASFECFLPGDYTLAETSVPEGYDKDKRKHDVTSENDGKITIDGEETFEWELFA